MKTIHFFLKYVFIPILLLGVATFQMMKIDDGLSRWKGGGFGMYADYFPPTFDLYMNQQRIVFNKKEDLKKYKIGHKALYCPSDKHIKSLIEYLDVKKDSVHVEIWSLQFDGATQQLKKQKRYDKLFLQTQ